MKFHIVAALAVAGLAAPLPRSRPRAALPPRRARLQGRCAPDPGEAEQMAAQRFQQRDAIVTAS